MYHFELTLEGQAVNEQWNDTARMFKDAAKTLADRFELATHDNLTPMDCSPVRAAQIARLYELAKNAYWSAAATTMGHKKSDRYHEQEQEMKAESVAWYQRFKALSPTYGSIPDFAKVGE